MSVARKAYSVVGVLLLAEYLAQVFLIAAAVSTVEGASDNARSVYSAFKSADAFAGAHTFNGGLVVNLTTLVLILFALTCGLPRRTTLLTMLLWLLLFIQFALAIVGNAVAGGVHGLLALAMIGLAGWLVVSTWAFRGPGPLQPRELAGGDPAGGTRPRPAPPPLRGRKR